jgi:MFS family permease
MNEVARRHLRRNFALGLLNGALFRLTDALVSPSLVLPLFVNHLTEAHFLIGLIQPIMQGGWFFPQLVISRYVQHRPRKKGFYTAAAGVRLLSWGLLTLAIFVLGETNPGLLLVTFFALLTSYSLGAGVGGLPFMDIVGKAIPARRRGLFFGARNFLGGSLAFGAGFLVKQILGEEEGFPFPINYGFLFAISLVMFGLAFFLFAQVVEPVEPVRHQEVHLFQHLGRALELVRQDPNYRRFLILRWALNAAGMAAPFYIVYAKQVLGVPTGMVGIYISAMSLVGVASNLLWARLSDRRGNKLVIQVSTLTGLLVPLVALLAPALQTILSQEAIHYAFALPFALLGAFNGGTLIGGVNLLLDIAPASDRPIYIGLTNTLLGVALFLSAVGGVIVDLAGFVALFSIALGLFTVALALSFSLQDPREVRMEEARA